MIRASIATTLFIGALAAVSAQAGTINLTPQVNGRIYDAGGNGVFDTITAPNPALSIRTFTTLAVDPFQERSAAEYSTAGIPADAVITSAAFKFDIIGIANSDTRVDIYGYAGDGKIALGDATAAAVLLGSYDPVALGLGAQTISLNVSALANLLKTSTWVGLRFQGIESTNTQLASIEGAALGWTAPTLVLVTANSDPVSTPEPASLTMAGLAVAGVAGFAMRKRRTA